MLSANWLHSLTEYTAALHTAGKSTRTVGKYTSNVQTFLDYMGDGTLDMVLVSAYGSHLRARYCAATCNSYSISINGFFRFLGMENLALPLYRIQRSFCLENEITVDEYRHMIAALRWNEDHKYYFIARILAGTGIRVGELPFFTVEALRHGWAEIELKNKVRQVFLPVSLRAELITYCSERFIQSGPVFLNRARSAPVDSSLVWRHLKKAACQAGVPRERCFPHNLRHLFARVYMETYGDILDLADILGHSSVETTRIYTRTSGGEKVRRISSLNL